MSGSGNILKLSRQRNQQNISSGLVRILECENNHIAAKEYQTKEKYSKLRMPNMVVTRKHYKKLCTCQRSLKRSMKKIEKVRNNAFTQRTKLKDVIEHVKNKDGTGGLENLQNGGP